MDPDQLSARGRVQRITRWGEPVLHAPCRPVTRFDEDLRQLAADLWVTMLAADGVGLAAPQIGSDLAVFVYDCPDPDGIVHRGVICNPEVDLHVGRERRLEDSDEGCLSLPGAYTDLARPDTATCRGQGLDGTPVAVHGEGLLARCLQHETDHLRGMVFGDRLSASARKRLYRDHERLAGQYPPDWPITARVVEDAADPE